MFGIKEQCSVCQKEIQPNEEVWMRMKYPSKRGMTEIKAFYIKRRNLYVWTALKKQKNESKAFSFQNIDIVYFIV
ncbi:Fe3+ hydroxamate ABC transporter substrate-binding protein [Priestia megaterium]|uniref:Fe3+ hydroxamate ABC transporter substrate-binding protein n=1 Tax=Priestia megaterium TaxID=1404 RepID=UPI000A484391|nr:Fe3+ hydroxamate ABC transporter substrate-binding protein [Priestia megaterium]